MGGITTSGRENLADLLTSGGRVITVTEAAAALELPRLAAAKKLARWADEGWLRRVRRGVYIPVPVEVTVPSTWTEDPLVLADTVWAPCYFTGWTSAGHWGLTEQVFRTIVVKTADRVRRREERLLEHSYLLAHTRDDDFWGLTTVWCGEVSVRMADPARTVIDVLDDPRIGGAIRHVARMVGTFLEEHAWTTLVDYGDRLGNGAVFKRLGYLAERIDHGDSALLEACRERVTAGISELDPSGPRGVGKRVSRWGVRANVHIDPPDAT